MKRIVLFFLSFLTLWLGEANFAWADENSGSGSTTTPSGFWDQYKAKEFKSIDPATKTLDITSEDELALFADIVIETGNENFYEPWNTGFEGWTVNFSSLIGERVYHATISKIDITIVTICLDI